MFDSEFDSEFNSKLESSPSGDSFAQADQYAIQNHEELDEVEQAFAGMSKEEMIQAIQAQVRQRPGRLIRGGEKRSAPVLSEPPRFVPRSLKAEEVTRVAPSSNQSLENDEGRVHQPDQQVKTIDLGHHEITVAQSNQSESDEVGAPSYITALPVSEEQLDPSTVIIKGSNQETSSQSESVFDEGEEADTGSLAQVVDAKALDPKSLSVMLERVGMPAWRVNSYDEGRGQILWLNNGAHIDYNPSGEVILGGENQDETRARLSQLGVLI